MSDERVTPSGWLPPVAPGSDPPRPRFQPAPPAPRVGPSRQAVWALVGAANRLVEDAKPWALARAEQEGDAEAARGLDAVLHDLAECLRVVAEALRPLLPSTAAGIAGQLGSDPAACWSQGLRWTGLAGGTRVATPRPLFPRRQPGQALSDGGSVIPSRHG